MDASQGIDKYVWALMGICDLCKSSCINGLGDSVSRSGFWTAVLRPRVDSNGETDHAGPPGCWEAGQWTTHNASCKGPG